MKTIIKLEELGLFILAIYLFSLLNFEWWWFLVLILAPDLAMLGYIFGNKNGAFFYNIFHHRGIAILVYILGCYFKNGTFTIDWNCFVFTFFDGSDVWLRFKI